MEVPWCTIGDFNVITSIEEKLGGIPYNMNKSFDFIGVIEACGLTDLGYTGLPFTWCNQRDAEARVWKRLDRSMVNDKWLEVMPETTIENLSSVSSDHSPMLMGMTKYNSAGKRVSMVKGFEENSRHSEEEHMTNNNEDSRQKLYQMNANYIRYLKMEESILKQKTQLQWFKDGDANNKYFHALIRGRRRKLFLHKIYNDNEGWIQGEEQIAQVTCDYYQNMFKGQNERINDRILQNIPTVVTPEQNEMLQAIPNMEELRQVVFAVNPNSAAGPDGIGVEKVSKKVCGWQARVLSFGAKITLIKHALQSIPIHTMAALSPPSTTIKYIETINGDFYWGKDQDRRKYHWASLHTMSLPYTEGGVGIRRLRDGMMLNTSSSKDMLQAISGNPLQATWDYSCNRIH
ncbi:hypothetical protein KY284_030208 [Solanum tuberosum]|nr:hypothetical protein KY284_030208 [Solanum tuberosum]